MKVLAALGAGADGSRAMLIDPPDDALTEAGALSPRPTVASSLQVAEPAPHIVWWPQRDELTAENLSRLAWMLSAAGGGKGWLVSDGDGESPSGDALREAAAASALRFEDEVPLEDGGVALRLTPAGE